MHNFSVIIPVYNEAESINELFTQLYEVLLRCEGEHEVLFVDDGSTDATPDHLARLCQAHAGIRYVRIHRNTGQSAAIALGIRLARYEIVVMLDADLQNDPADIPRLFAGLSDADMVCGWRSERRDSAYKRIVSRLANALRRFLLDDEVHDTGCTLKVFRKSFVAHAPVFYGYHRFLPALAKMQGARISEMTVHHRPRRHGVSKYPFHRRLIKPIVDLMGVMWLKHRVLTIEWEER